MAGGKSQTKDTHMMPHSSLHLQQRDDAVRWGGSGVASCVSWRRKCVSCTSALCQMRMFASLSQKGYPGKLLGAQRHFIDPRDPKEPRRASQDQADSTRCRLQYSR